MEILFENCAPFHDSLIAEKLKTLSRAELQEALMFLDSYPEVTSTNETKFICHFMATDDCPLHIKNLIKEDITCILNQTLTIQERNKYSSRATTFDSWIDRLGSKESVNYYSLIETANQLRCWYIGCILLLIQRELKSRQLPTRKG